MVGNHWVEVADVDLEGLLLLVLVVRVYAVVIVRTAAATCMIGWVVGPAAHTVVVVVAHAAGSASIVVVHLALVVGTRHASSVGSPIELKESIFLSRNLFSVQSRENIPSGFKILKLNKPVADRLVRLLILNQFNIDDVGNLIKLLGNILLIHVWQNISDPERLPLLLLLLLLRLLRHGCALHLLGGGAAADASASVLLVASFVHVHVAWLLHFYF